MKTAIPILLFCVCEALALPNFVSIGSADVLVVTHEVLRTSGWTPDSTTSWESRLLTQKQSQGYETAIHEVEDNDVASDIESYISSNGSNLRFVLIVGDYDRRDTLVDSPDWFDVDFATKKFVPLYGEIADFGGSAGLLEDYPLENDLGFIQTLGTEVSIGRIPAESREEILVYLDKVGDYLSLGEPTWAKKNLLAIDDQYHGWVGLSEAEAHRWASRILAITPAEWSSDTLFATDFSDAVRDDTFRVRIDSGYGTIMSYGAASHMDNLNYFFGDTSSTNFQNSGKYPVLFGLNCDIGAFQRPVKVQTGGWPALVTNYYWDRCVVEKLLFQQDGGIIAAVAPTFWTFVRGNAIEAEKALGCLTNDNIKTFGGIWRCVQELSTDTLFGNTFPDWQLENLILLGDPTLKFPTAIEPCGVWTTDISPVIIDDTLTIASGCTLTIEAGVELLFDQGAAIRVNSGGSLVVNGTSSDSVIMQRKDANEKWRGIHVLGGSLEMHYVSISGSDSALIHTDAPTAVLVDNCYLDGSNLVTLAPMLWMFNAPSVTQKVHNTTAENAGTGLYSSNCKVEFINDTIRNCSWVNSLISKTSGHIHQCYFEGRPSNYSVLFYSATCNPNVTCCTFKNLARNSGSYEATVNTGTNCSPTFAGDYGLDAYPDKSNVLQDSSNYLLKMNGGSPRPTILINDWFQYNGSGKFIYWGSATSNPPFDVTDQYWNSAPTASKFYPANASYWNWSSEETSPWELCSPDEAGGGSITMPDGLASRRGSLDDGPTDEELLAEALAMEGREAYEDARVAYQGLALSASSSDTRWRAMVGCVSTDIHCAISAEWIETYLDSLEIIEGSGYPSHITRTRITYSHYMNQERYDDAINECTVLLNSGLELVDSLTVAIDLIGIQMAAGLIDNWGLDDATSSMIPQSLRVSSAMQAKAREFELLDALGRAYAGKEVTEASIPTTFALHQNYPNPFNPSTEIRFDLPEAIRVELKIFNILGQEVATLVDDVRSAGAYQILWDGKSEGGLSVSSGVYVYQIKAGNFQDAKKMVLLR